MYSLTGRLRRPFAHPSGVGGIIVYGTDIQTDAHTYGTDIQTDAHTYGTDIQTDAHTYGTDIQTDTPMGQTYRQTHMACAQRAWVRLNEKKRYIKNSFKIHYWGAYGTF